jgi:hypothetical protein
MEFLEMKKGFKARSKERQRLKNDISRPVKQEEEYEG